MHFVRLGVMHKYVTVTATCYYSVTLCVGQKRREREEERERESEREREREIDR